MTPQAIGAPPRTNKWTVKVVWVCAAVLSFAFLPHSVISSAAETTLLQPQEQFEAAIRNLSTSPNLILLTVVDDRTGESWTGCTLAPLLLGAISKERGSDRVVSAQEVTQIALSNTSHVFHFSNPTALHNLTTVIDPSSALNGTVSNACIEMRKTGCMRQQDLTGQFVPCGR